MLAALLLVLGVFASRFTLKPPPEDYSAPKYVGPHFEPTGGYLGHLRDEVEKRQRNVHEKSYQLVGLISPQDRERVKACCTGFLRFHDAKGGYDVLLLRRCYNWLCPTCADVLHFRRTTYIARKIASLNPAEEPLPALANVVFTLPPILAEWLRTDPRVNKAWRTAIRRTIARAYGFEGKHGASFERACWQSLGALFTLHAWGDKSWPKFHPHYDILIPAWRRVGDKLKPLRKTWPERYERTRATYRHELREALLPLAQRPLPRVDLITFLRSGFAVDWHVSLPPPTRLKGNIIHTVSALHRIRYNLRPMWHGANAWTYAWPDKTKPELAYDFGASKKKSGTMHYVPLDVGVSIVRGLKPFLTGKETRVQYGIFSKVSYAHAARLAGHEPVKERENRGLTLKARYEERPEGGFNAKALPVRGREPSSEEAFS